MYINLKLADMKRLYFATLLLLIVSNASFSRELVAVGKSYTALGDYKIETSDNPVVIKGDTLMTYVISYQNSPMEVTVVIKNTKKCKNFIVLSDKLSIQYVCNDNYFGVEKLDKSLKKQGWVTDDTALDRSAYFHQKIISAGQNSEVMNANLIASFFPLLIKDSEKVTSSI